MDKVFENADQKIVDEKCGPSKLNEYEKPFTQSEVHYVLTAANQNERCAACRFFKHKNNYDPCLIVTNDAPLPIVEGGTCDWFDPIEVREPEPMPVEIVSVVEMVVESESDDDDDDDYRAGYDDPKKKPKKPKKKPGEAADPEDEEDDEEDVEKLAAEAIVKLQRLPIVLRKLYQPIDVHGPEFSVRVSPDMFEDASGFKLIRSADKVAWVGWYSNNFKDKEKDIFAEVGFDHYDKMTASGDWPLPELWCMHQKYLKHGRAVKTLRLGHFQIAVGVFDDPLSNPLVSQFIKYYDENPVTMSHGFYYDRKDYVNQVFLKFRTFEVSTVKPGREANNHYTRLELEDVKESII